MGQRSDDLTKTMIVGPYEVKEIAQLHLFGEWNLKIRFTYKISQVTK